MKRTKIDILEVCSFPNLVSAAIKAAKGKKQHLEVRHFFEHFDENLFKLQSYLLNCRIPCQGLQKFIIFDPKKRIIHAPCFQDRVLHHALMNFLGPILDQRMMNSSFACRIGKGVHLAVKQVQKNIRKYPWYVKIDIESYFDSIDHVLIQNNLQRCIKGDEVINLIVRIIESYQVSPGKGLPIGALPSQHFANYFLNSVDRFILEELKLKAHVRYMDDIIWWSGSKEQAKSSLLQVTEYIEKNLLLKVKTSVTQINKSKKGVTFCGFRILFGKIKLSARKRSRYSLMRSKWENAYELGLVTNTKLQCAYASVNAMTTNADSIGWKKQQLCRYPAPDC